MRLPSRTRLRVAGVVTALTAALGLVTAPTSSADPAGAHVTRVEKISDTKYVVWVYSPSMDTEIANDVLRPAGGGSTPTLYLLNGIGGGVDRVGWAWDSNYDQFFADKRVTVVSPVGGIASFYTDWKTPDLVTGNHKWQTFLTRELPGAIDRQFGNNGRNAIAGVSMSGGPALDLAIQAPDVYQATASYSGCPAISNPLGIAGITVTALSKGANAFNMFGAPWDPAWVQHDPAANAAALRGKAIYVSAASGMWGPVDNLAPGSVPPIGGTVVEAVTMSCTQAFAGALAAAGVPATVDLRPIGAHTWGLFESQLRESWKTIGPAIGA